MRGTLHEDLCTFMKISWWIFLRMINISDKSCRENENRHCVFSIYFYRALGGTVVWDTPLQAGGSRVLFPIISRNFFFWHNLSSRFCGSAVDSACDRNGYQEYSLGVKAAGVQVRQRYHLHVPIVSKAGSLNLLELLGPLRVSYSDSFKFIF
jgi:hypothetical protein